MMKHHLFTPPGQQALEAVMQRRPLLAFDFDGTLAPIVTRPDDARVSIGVAQRLAQLAAHLPVAIVTGRSVDDVAPRLGFDPHYIIGNHGAEDPEQPQLPPEVYTALTDQLNVLRVKIEGNADALASAGIQVEDKRHSLALHYRLARDRDAALITIETLLRGLDPALSSFGGKCVVNVVAADAPDKGDAVAMLVKRSQSGAALFIGDDLNDESVFESAEPHWLTVRIGREDPLSRARYYLDTHSEVATMLQKMLALLR
ncbi:MAG: trehalose-phosphatase [Aquabacterium sp.]|uniref:trehalose-phosphatase n=1 Tax=Aquabacterium sp. TaxID=1872578 RepID=UPI002728C086|nr:trehalose-phosphatase [Aquabacterium sp.]MDO9005281.1 trehalose-phosphatase [Aquabacterium sp.]